MPSVLLKELSSAQVREVTARGATLLLPAGCVECHGNHLPVGTDTLIAEAAVAGVASRIDAIVCPTIEYGPTGYAVSGPKDGTIDVAPQAFYAYAKDVLDGLLRMGFRNVVVVVHHQGDDMPEAEAFRFAFATIFNELSASRGEGWWGQKPGQTWPQATVLSTLPRHFWNDVPPDHAGATETSLLLHLHPELVDVNALAPDDYWFNWQAGQASAMATAADGQAMFLRLVENLLARIAALPGILLTGDGPSQY